MKWNFLKMEYEINSQFPWFSTVRYEKWKLEKRYDVIRQKNDNETAGVGIETGAAWGRH